MKKLLLAVCLMFGGATLVSAQNDPSSTSQTQTTQDQDQEKQQISVSELPDAVTAKLEAQDYSGWTVGNAYKKMDDSNQEMYIVELRQGTETKKVKFDRDGNELEKGKHGDKHGDKADNSNYRHDEASETDQPAEADESTQADESSESDESTQPDQADNSSTEIEQQ